MDDSLRIGEVGVALIVELALLGGDNGSNISEGRDTDRLLCRSARNTIALLLLMSVGTDDFTGKIIGTSLCSVPCSLRGTFLPCDKTRWSAGVEVDRSLTEDKFVKLVPLL